MFWLVVSIIFISPLMSAGLVRRRVMRRLYQLKSELGSVVPALTLVVL